jgi:hypothetical protein
MNKERRDERYAKAIVEKTLKIELEHADKEGGVDYRSTDGRHAVEVTRITEGRKRAGRDALNVSRSNQYSRGGASDLLGGACTAQWQLFDALHARVSNLIAARGLRVPV